MYFNVDDCDAMFEHVQELDGRQLMPPTDVPMAGRMAWVADPQGARFAIMRPMPPAAM